MAQEDPQIPSGRFGVAVFAAFFVYDLINIQMDAAPWGAVGAAIVAVLALKGISAVMRRPRTRSMS